IYGVRIPWTNVKFFEFRGPKHGEVIVFIKPCEPDRDYIKRVIATAGETVEVRCNIVYVNGQPIESTLVDGTNCQYWDLKEGATEPTLETCSLYRETVDGLSYLTYHDRNRPVRDDKRKQVGALTNEDLGYETQREFPKLNGLGTSPPVCSLLPEERDN